MKIRIENPYTHKGDVYCFTFDFAGWLQNELGTQIEESEAFAKKFGKDWELIFAWRKELRIESRTVTGPWIDRKYKEIRWGIEVPHFELASPNARNYELKLRELLEGIVTILTNEHIDGSKIQEAIPVLLRRFSSQLNMLKHDPHPYTYGTPEDPYGHKKTTAEPAKPKAKTAANFVKRKLPQWKIPKDIAKRVEDEGGTWESERFDPILLTVSSETSYEGRDIPLAWQIEFDPFDERLAAANEKLEPSDTEPDGDGWAEAVEAKFAKHYPKLAGQLHSDSESSTCVLWVESESACKKLLALVWSLIYPK